MPETILKKEKILFLWILIFLGFAAGSIKGYLSFVQEQSAMGYFLIMPSLAAAVLLIILIKKPEAYKESLYAIAAIIFILQILHFYYGMNGAFSVLFPLYPVVYFFLFGLTGVYWSGGLLAAYTTAFFLNGSSESVPLFNVSAALITVSVLFALHAIEIKRRTHIISFFSETDPLTSLLNRGAFLPILENEIKRLKRNPEIHSLSASIIEINDFEKINSKFGQTAGDKIIAELSGLIKDWLRIEDTMARWSGSEFIILFRETDLEHAKHVIEKLYEKIDRHRFEFVNHLTCSFGIAAFHKEEQRNDFLNRVEKALDKAKQNTHTSNVAVD
ncbi:MAG: GGDEF domain-containing protein [Spirochaetia bacterium]|nr:GGDEF domain-containing protein [Spirochaetia bacterium]